MFNNPFLMQMFQPRPMMGLGGLRPPSDVPHPMFGGFRPPSDGPRIGGMFQQGQMPQGVAYGEQNPGFSGLSSLMARRPAPRVLR